VAEGSKRTMFTQVLDHSQSIYESSNPEVAVSLSAYNDEKVAVSLSAYNGKFESVSVSAVGSNLTSPVKGASPVRGSAHTLNQLTDCRQTNKLDQFVTIQHVAINTHRNKLFHYHIGMIDYSYITLSGRGSLKP
jgi:hypothetical protein